jgi:hypothetical protein
MFLIFFLFFCRYRTGASLMCLIFHTEGTDTTFNKDSFLVLVKLSILFSAEHLSGFLMKGCATKFKRFEICVRLWIISLLRVAFKCFLIGLSDCEIYLWMYAWIVNECSTGTNVGLILDFFKGVVLGVWVRLLLKTTVRSESIGLEFYRFQFGSNTVPKCLKMVKFVLYGSSSCRVLWIIIYLNCRQEQSQV